MLTTLLAGFGLGLSLIVAIGAQNLFVLRQGLRREHVFLVAGVCAASDALLIALGVSGIGFVLGAVPWLVDVARWGGAIFLVVYGLLAARRAWRPSGETLQSTRVSGPGDRAGDDASDESLESSRRDSATATRIRPRAMAVLATCLALTWLNPHVYLDTVFLLGTVANTHEAKWVFAVGAMLGSIVWFFGLAVGARYLGRWLSTPRAWRMLDGAIAVVMIALGVSLVWPH